MTPSKPAWFLNVSISTRPSPAQYMATDLSRSLTGRAILNCRLAVVASTTGLLLGVGLAHVFHVVVRLRPARLVLLLLHLVHGVVLRFRLAHGIVLHRVLLHPVLGKRAEAGDGKRKRGCD